MKRYWYVSVFLKGAFVGMMYASDGEFRYSDFEDFVCPKLNIKVTDMCVFGVRETSKDDFDAVNSAISKEKEKEKREGEQVKG